MCMKRFLLLIYVPRGLSLKKNLKPIPQKMVQVAKIMILDTFKHQVLDLYDV